MLGSRPFQVASLSDFATVRLPNTLAPWNLRPRPRSTIELGELRPIDRG